MGEMAYDDAGYDAGYEEAVDGYEADPAGETQGFDEWLAARDEQLISGFRDAIAELVGPLHEEHHRGIVDRGTSEAHELLAGHGVDEKQRQDAFERARELLGEVPQETIAEWAEQTGMSVNAAAEEFAKEALRLAAGEFAPTPKTYEQVAERWGWPSREAPAKGSGRADGAKSYDDVIAAWGPR